MFSCKNASWEWNCHRRFRTSLIPCCQWRSVCPFLALLFFVSAFFSNAQAGVTVSQSITASQITLRWTAPTVPTTFTVQIDDTPYFRKPLYSNRTTINAMTLLFYKIGLTPGVTYYAKVSPGVYTTSFRLAVPSWTESYLSYSFAKSAWQYWIRAKLASLSGLNWNGSAWILNTSWADANTQTSQDAYHMEIVIRSMLNLAAVHGDVTLLNELAQFFLAYEPRFTTLGAMRAMQSSSVDTSALVGQGPDSTRTLISVTTSGTKKIVAECTLCTAQFLQPVARLIRLITTLPLSQRTANMNAFVTYYAPLVTQDHLIRQIYEATVDYWGAYQSLYLTSYDILHSTTKPTYSYQHAMYDRDLWLLAAAAEILGANANDPSSVPLNSTQFEDLNRAIGVGVALLLHKRTYYSTTQNLQGIVVGSMSYFNGDFDDHPDYRYSGYTTAAFPPSTPADSKAGLSWDTGHIYRLPVLLRSLYDNRKATGMVFPTLTDLQLVSNQFLYRVFNRNLTQPLFHNYFDGWNGWYRVGYYNSTFGYPPSLYCVFDESQTPCLTQGALMGWGLLAFANSDLTNLYRSVLALGYRQDSASVTFRNRYYGTTMSFFDGSSFDMYPQSMLFYTLAAIPWKLN